MDQLKFEEIKKGMKVRDNYGNVGVATLRKDLHNITVKFDNNIGGYSIYCIDPTYKIHYNPLYRVK